MSESRVIRPLRILHVPNDLGGHPSALASAQRQLGHEAVCVSLSYSALGFNGDENHDAPQGIQGRLFTRELARFGLLWRSLRWADIVHCHFGQTLMSVRSQPVPDLSRSGLTEALTLAYARALWVRDLALWRLAGKRVVMTFYGDDVRLVGVSVARNAHTHLALPGFHEEFVRRDQWKRNLVRALIRNNVKMFFTNPDLLLGLSADAIFVPYGNVDPADYDVTPPKSAGPLRFIHMPTDRDVKGTSLFIAAIDRLRDEGLDCTLTLIEGATNTDALTALREHDVLLDQLRVGWYGSVTVEAMAMGKPAVAYLHPEDKKSVPPEFSAALPIVEASPDTVTEVLRSLVVMPRSNLIARGAASRRFVEQWHAPMALARTMLAAYRAD